MSHTTRQIPIPSHLTRHSKVGKQRRATGDPVAELKEMTRFEAIPQPSPQRLTVPFNVFDTDASRRSEDAGQLVFHCVGDVGGVNGTATQEAIAAAMEDQITASSDQDRPAFLYILGDVVYFNGQQRLYKTEFYEPYQFYRSLIFAIPGNHDGDTHVRRGDQPDIEPSLYGFFENFCDSAPRHVSPYRMSMTQPYPYWTLDTPFVTIIGLYSNVEGSLDARGRSDQQYFLESQIANVPDGKKFVVAVHHPPYSLDAAHGGCPDILDALDLAVEHTGRHPDAVLSGHVHNYQRFSRLVNGRKIPYVVAGAGGYANDSRSMHKLQKALREPKVSLPYPTTVAGVSLEKYEEEEPGFLRVTATPKKLTFEYFVVPFDQTVPPRLLETFEA